MPRRPTLNLLDNQLGVYLLKKEVHGIHYMQNGGLIGPMRAPFYLPQFRQDASHGPDVRGRPIVVAAKQNLRWSVPQRDDFVSVLSDSNGEYLCDSKGREGKGREAKGS